VPVRSFVATGSVALTRVGRVRAQIIGSFAQMHCFPRAIAYLESGKISVKGMVSVSLRVHPSHGEA
jgi:hypothetical protein